MTAYFLAYLLPLTAVIGLVWEDSLGLGGFLTPVFAYGFVPVVDWIVDRLLRDKQRVEDVSDWPWWMYRLVVWLWPVVQTGTLLLYVWDVMERGADKVLARALSMGFVAAGGINVAHELFHKRRWMERAAGRYLLVLAGYGHFAVEHSLGHHRKVATEEDPATARLGESFYAFFPRVVSRSWASAWALRPAEVGFLTAIEIISGLMAYVLLGRTVALFLVGQAMVAVLILEKVNYIEHYGLVRQKDERGMYERVGPTHSWDAPQRVTNILLLKLQRHSDHHLHAWKEYHTLQLDHRSPVLPFGYPTLAVLVMFPPLWRALMDRRALEARDWSQRELWAHHRSR